MAGLPPWIATPPKRWGRVETITPTAEEAANGWTEESLSKYVAERRAAQAMVMDPAARRPQLQTRQNGHRWSFPNTRTTFTVPRSQSRLIRTMTWCLASTPGLSLPV